MHIISECNHNFLTKPMMISTRVICEGIHISTLSPPCIATISNALIPMHALLCCANY